MVIAREDEIDAARAEDVVAVTNRRFHVLADHIDGLAIPRTVSIVSTSAGVLSGR